MGIPRLRHVNLRTLTLWIVGIGAFGLMLYTCALPGDLPADGDRTGFAGTYTVNGVDPLEVEYSGTVIITETSNTTRYDVEWIVTGGIHRGVGTRSGDEFTVDWSAISSGGGTGSGTAVYVIEPDGRLVGTKSVDGFELAGTEEIVPAP
jgi:hypothetical protein